MMETVIAYTMMRLALGINILMHGVVRWKAGRHAFANMIDQEFMGSIIPPSVVKRFALALPVLESAIGLLLLLGLFTQVSIIAGMALMFLLLLGKSLKSDWQVVSLQMIYIGFYGLLELLYRYNHWSLDSVFFF